MQSRAMEMLDNLDKNPATGMGKKVSTVHTLYILVLSFCRGVGSGYRVRARHSPNPLFLKRRATIANAIANGMAPTLHKLGH